MNRYVVARGSATANSGVEPADARQIDQADDRLAGDRIADRNAPQRQPAQKIVGAVDWVDHPAALTGGAAALLAEKADIRKGFGQPGPDRLLDRTVGDADEVLRSLGLA